MPRRKLPVMCVRLRFRNCRKGGSPLLQAVSLPNSFYHLTLEWLSKAYHSFSCVLVEPDRSSLSGTCKSVFWRPTTAEKQSGSGYHHVDCENATEFFSCSIKDAAVAGRVPQPNRDAT